MWESLLVICCQIYQILEEYVDKGKIRSIGVSNFNPHHLDELLEYARIRPVVNQIEIEPYMTQHDVVDYTFRKGIQVEAWGPLGQGVTGVLDDPAIGEIAARHGKSAAQVILRWHMQRGLVTIPRCDNDAYTDKKMKIVVLTGSPLRNGNTNHLAGHFIKGAEEAGHEVYRCDCAQRKVSSYIACNRCGMNGQCIFNDDFEQLRPHLVAADMVVFTTPMYYFGFSSQLKVVIDRFYALNGQIKGSEKRSALLMLSHYHTLLRYLGWKDSGTVVAAGMWPAGAVNGTEYSRQAYELGRKCFG